MQKIISLVQTNFLVGPEIANAWYLPYTAGCIWAYAQQSEIVSQQYKLGEIVFLRDPLEETAQKLAQHDVVAFSCYVWNRNYNYALARRIKELNADCLIICGGPELPVEQPTIFNQLPFVDIVVKKEGEIAFRKILECYTSNYKHIPGLLLNNNETVYDTGPAERIEDLSDLPSPYLAGVFDNLIANHPEISWAATLETNRGCPYQCTFCDWGSLTYSKVKKFNLDKVVKEIEWFSKNQCGSMFIADANFGMYPERDGQIIDTIVYQATQHGYPKFFNLTWAKNKKEEVVSLARKWVEADILAPAFTMSVQSLDNVVLENVKRKNMEMSKAEVMFNLCEKQGVPINTELILGLPGETIDSWKNNFWRLFESNNHRGIDIYMSQLYENAEMNLKQKSIFKLQYVSATDFFKYSHGDDVKEPVNIVYGTSTMPKEKMIDAQAFNAFMQCTHLTGVTTWVARFIRKYCQVSYKEFYTGLYQHLLSWAWFVECEKEVRDCYEQFYTNGKIVHTGINGIVVTGDRVIDMIRWRMIDDQKTNEFLEKVSEYVSQFKLDSTLHDQLFKFQHANVLQFETLPALPLIKKFDYDISGYIVDDSNLIAPITVEFFYPPNERTSMDKKTFLSMIWFGRRRSFGTTKFKKSIVDCNTDLCIRQST